jgi:hypothetical protein
MEVLDGIFFNRFKAELKTYLQSKYQPQLGQMSQEALQAFVEKGIEKAFGYGIKIEADVTAFLERLIRYGAEMDNDPAQPWIGQLLNDPQMPGPHKMGAFEQIELETELKREHAAAGKTAA